MNPEGSSGAGPAASRPLPLDSQAFLLHTGPCPTQPLRVSFSLGKEENTKKQTLSLMRHMPCSSVRKSSRGKWKVEGNVLLVE